MSAFLMDFSYPVFIGGYLATELEGRAQIGVVSGTGEILVEAIEIHELGSGFNERARYFSVSNTPYHEQIRSWLLTDKWAVEQIEEVGREQWGRGAWLARPEAKAAA